VCWGKEEYHLCSASYDQTIKIWDMRSAVPLHTIAAHEGKVLCVTVGPGEPLVSVDWGEDRRVGVEGARWSCLVRAGWCSAATSLHRSEFRIQGHGKALPQSHNVGACFLLFSPLLPPRLAFSVFLHLLHPPLAPPPAPPLDALNRRRDRQRRNRR